jgi:hypothetical protein
MTIEWRRRMKALVSVERSHQVVLVEREHPKHLLFIDSRSRSALLRGNQTSKKIRMEVFHSSPLLNQTHPKCGTS